MNSTPELPDHEEVPPANEPEAAADAPAAPAQPAGRAKARSRNRPEEKATVVAIGGSSGALRSLEQFFAHMPPHTGLVFVLVLHYQAGADGAGTDLVEVVQQFTAMRVTEAHDNERLQPNHVYLNPPSQELSLLHGNLLLLQPTQPVPRRQPIDFFLQSLAKDAGERAVCIIFSGVGADGSLGLKLVMENFGMVMVQDPDTAQFDAMPRAALATEFVDFVLPPERMAAQLLDYVARPLVARTAPELDEAGTVRPMHALQKIFLLIRAQTGHDFSFYKRNTVFRRIERRMNSHQIREFTHYVRYLQENPGEVEQLFHELLIGVTKFFRDAEAFEHLKEHLRPLVADKPADSTLRVWAPGCSTGEEAYSLAITLFELIDEVAPQQHLKVQIFATDISPAGIATARAGQYSDNTVAEVGPERLERFFRKTEYGYQIRKEVRDVVVFALHNINKDAPFIRLDLLVCRNLLIYLSAELQRNLLPVFHYALLPNGLLFLGPSENITGFHDLFQPLDVKWKISRRNVLTTALPQLIKFPFSLGPQALPLPPTPLMLPAASLSHRPSGPFVTLIQRTLLQSYSPPAVVIDGKGEILYVNGRTGRYLEPAPGLGGMNLFEMARAELNFEISGAVHRAQQSRENVVVDNVRVKTDTGRQLLRLTVRHLTEYEQLVGLLLVVFEDQPTPRRVRQAKHEPSADSRQHEAMIEALDKELQYTKHRLQSTVEEMESSLEELKSTNEELQSANEELQSTNEEAMTNKEEMQSLNEELMTLNMQYLAKTEELSQSANDMKNLLDATEIAIVFLDNNLLVKRFTPPVSRIISLLPGDLGRPLAHFTSNLRYEHLLRDIQQVLDRLTPIELSIQTLRDEWYTMRALPYRSLDNYINGVVITFTDITTLKTLETQLQENARFTESLAETVREPLLAIDADLRVYSASQAFAELVQEPAAELPGQLLTTLSGGAWNQPALLRQLLLLLNPSEAVAEFDNLTLEVALPPLGRRRVHLYGRCMQRQGQPTGRVLLGIKEVEVPAAP